MLVSTPQLTLDYGVVLGTGMFALAPEVSALAMSTPI
ncbi:hypothetical protein F441_20066 [Phytophthora nicotianae CJ01A1]|uniref:Uncharacterized protein n=5 Tax=Phytophthora nicotianae TaxID=4792 RepID=V9FMZ0_PHYNI|nr:hypothetical protein F443_04644 [Phytophthora nicotianae P1569]ETK72129.1 hypothetical protein L915_20721 [Phytophthora nicotianae]ETO60481.1 hypothetical protein F444_21341 [Phytophthora nicotianae P1976]ETP02926.1 hypothetical protein F441_20066 [Phytophthora nicotianae CJ01A1]ETP49913.1 hypothetical protein F442_04691 [Phytophthora nicotianae P10297]